MNGWTLKRRPRKKGQMIPITTNRKTALAELRAQLTDQLLEDQRQAIDPDQAAEDLAPALIAALGRYGAAVVVGLVKTQLRTQDDVDQVLEDVWPVIQAQVQ